MNATIFLGHILAVLVLLAILASIGFGFSWARHRGYERGTPQYARARGARRSAAYALAATLPGNSSVVLEPRCPTVRPCATWAIRDRQYQCFLLGNGCLRHIIVAGSE